MKSAIFTGASVVALMLASVMPATTRAQARPPVASDDDQAAGEQTDPSDIIVTASKRNERELDVAGAIKTFTGDQLLAQGLTNLRDYATLTPGLTIDQSNGSGTPVIRGIGTGLDLGSLAGIIVNGAQIGSSSTLSPGASDALDLDPIDLQRVEVLKGPQGTLYGANTLSGLVSYTLRDPDLKTPTAIARGEVSGTEHGETSWSVRSAVSAPIVTDALGVRVSGHRDRRGGFIDNTVRGLSNQNDARNWGINGSILATPTERLRIMLAGFYQRTDFARDAVLYDATTRRPLNGDLQYNDRLFPTYDKKVRAGIGTISYDFGFANLSSISAYQDTDSFNGLNGSRAGIAGSLPFLQLVGGPAAAPGTAARIISDNGVKKFTQELQLTSSSGGPFQWLLGGYYVHEKDVYVSAVNAATNAGVDIPALAPAYSFNLFAKYREYAGFANATYKFSERFDVTGGIRVGEIDQRARQTFTGAGVAALNLLLAPNPIPTVVPTSRDSKTVVNYLATARFHFSADGMVFARFATGFRPGGPNLAAPGLAPTFKPDDTRNYEVGVKTRFWDGKGTIDVTGYYTDWSDIIVLAPGTAGINGVGNGGDARVYGVESVLTLRPVQGLSVTGTVAYSNAKITDVAAGNVLTGDGDRLPNNPRWSGSVLADYRFPTGTAWQGVVGGTARFVGSRHSAFESSPFPVDYVMPRYSLFDVHAGMQSERLDIDLFVRNLTDKRAQLGTYTVNNLIETTVQRPRTMGVAVTARY